MNRIVLTLSYALALAAAPAAAWQAAPAAKGTAQEATKTVSGTITSVSASSISVKAASGDMTFNVDDKTRVTAPGGGTKTRAAQAEGKAGPSITEVLKSGQAVEVRYHETGMHAASIRAIASVPDGAMSAKAQTAAGTVSAVSGNSLTVKGAGGEWTFTVDDKTTVSGTGLGTAGKKLQAAGGKPTLTEFVHEGDTVSVTYHEAAGAKHAGVVRITRKKM